MKTRLGIESIEVPFEDPERIEFIDSNGKPRMYLRETLLAYRGEPGHHEVPLDGLYLSSSHGPIPVRALRFDVETVPLPPDTVSIVGLSAARAVLEEFGSAPPTYLMPNGSVSHDPM